MPSLSFSSITAQVAEHLCGELSQGRWQGTMPGRNQLATELGVSRKTVQGALELLEEAGMLASQGAGRPRRIVASAPESTASLRIAVLNYEPMVATKGHMIELIHRLEDRGHAPFFAKKSLVELGDQVSRVAKLVEASEADAWIVDAGSREVLSWFTDRKEPTLALFGRSEGLKVAAARPDKVPALAAATQRLIELGHRRISFLCRHTLRLPHPGRTAMAFLAELEASGIPPGNFHLPDWEESREGFTQELESLFEVTPPTALILDEASVYHAAHHFLGKRGLRVPADVSLICTDNDPSFAWCDPQVACIDWSIQPILRRIVRWADKVATGQRDVHQTFTKAHYVDGGTVGPAKPGAAKR